jgi:glutamine synthetase
MLKHGQKRGLMNYCDTPHSQLIQQLQRDHDCIPVVALEIEWYVTDADHQPVLPSMRDRYLTELAKQCASLPIHSINSEDGAGQVEAALLPTRSIEQLIEQYTELQRIALHTAHSFGWQTDFTAKPFPDQHGSGIHLHVHLENETAQLLFWKEHDTLSPHLAHSISGLLRHMQHDLAIFAGSASAMARYVAGYHAPTTVSWGMNNRTTALRLPDSMGHVAGMDAILAAGSSTDIRRFKRIEHRVASSEAILIDVITAILAAIYDGLQHPMPPPPPIYGDASLAEYALPTLYPRTNTQVSSSESNSEKP